MGERNVSDRAVMTLLPLPSVQVFWVCISVSLPVAAKAGLAGAAVIAIGLVGRTIGVQICLLKSSFNCKERLFISIAYLPKATVQAAIGGMPLAAMVVAGMDVGPGEMILAIAVLSIILTAPLGAVLIAWNGKRLL